MQFSNILLALPFLSLSLAAPTAEVEVVATEVLDKRIANNMCERHISPGNIHQFTLWMAGWGNNDETSKSGCGGGLLDNLRGQCGGSSSINSWQCYAVAENPHDTRVTFSLNTWAIASSPWCVTDAMWLASPSSNKATGVTCRDV